MARFSYKCPEHGDFTVTLKKRVKKMPCPECQKESCAIIRAGTIQVVERLDNGAMARAVERLHDIDDIMYDRSEEHSKLQKDLMGIVEDEDEE